MLRWCTLFCFIPLLFAQSDDVRAVLTHSEEAWNRGDLAAFASYYDDSPETTFVGREVVRGGVQTILGRYRKAYPTREAMGTLSFSNIDVRMLAPDLALVTGEFQLERTAAGGGNAAGRYTLILRKTPSGWKIIHDHTSSATKNAYTGFMLKMLLSASLLVFAAALFGAASVYEFTLNSIDGAPAPLAAYKGKVLLLVNVASKCGFTPQYKELEAVYEKYKDQGLVVAGFPANNFGAQEPGTNEEIKTFCTRKYSVTFPMYSKISVKGSDIAPLYEYLTKSTGGDIKWNFTKFLIGKDGAIVARFESKVKPDDPEVTAAIEKALTQ